MNSSSRFLRALAWFAIVLAAWLSTTPASGATLKVACTGTSAMMGLGSTTGHHAPDEMGKVLGAGFEVHNYGVQGTTAIASISSSYAATSQMKAALALNPDIVLFWFGGNDSFAGTWEAHKTEFKADYTSLVHAFQALPSHPKTFLVRLWVFVDTPVRRTVIDQEILPIIDQIGAETGSTLIDYRAAFAMHPEYFPDGMHPNDTGTLAIGKLFADVVTKTLAAGGTDAGIGVDGATGVDAAGSGSDGAADHATGNVEDAAAEAGPEPIPTGAAGSRGGTGGSSGSGTGGATGGASQTGAGAGNMPPPPGDPGTDGGGCRMSHRGGAGSQGWLLVALLGLCRLRRRTCS